MQALRLIAGLAVLAAPCADGETFKASFWADGPAGEFRVEVDARPVEIRSVATPADELVLLLVMDTVKFLDRSDAARDAIIDGLAGLGKKYYAGLMSAQDGLTVHLDPSRGRAKLRDKFQSIDVRGVPGLLDVVEQVSEIADYTLEAGDVRVAVLLVTDGEIEDYRGDYTIPVVNPSDRRDLSRRFRSELILQRIRSISDSLRTSQAPLFFLHLARQYDDLNEVYQNGISEFARQTGGRALFAAGLQEVPAMVQSLLEEISSLSVVTFEAECEGIHRLEIRSAGGPARHREMIGCLPAGS